ncbi:hypothetical protein L6250_03800 [Candidatus Parcubacteria bacterium]|nr:hypothetical protein [Patescibacteria group bacterium]MBU4466844.1 hypothetical protein [Patescibacteria group bacterium]MCG2688725.1 hypothetical protein [Candidatus Parcubacteria bacterium]
MNKEISSLIELLSLKKELTGMMAPSFPIMFSYPDIVGKLARLGFNHVIEVAVGAKETNKNLMAILTKDPKAKLITSPCASLTRIIKTKYPHLVKYLTPIDSPMIYTARIAKEKWPASKPVFIGPCPVKKLEAQDYSKLDILVITFKELKEVFQHFDLKDEIADQDSSFDFEEMATRLYPISGGLSQSNNLETLLAEDEYQVVSGWENCVKALDNFEKNTWLKVLDILYCDGGCLNGLGIDSSLNVDERRKKIVDFWQNR